MNKPKSETFEQYYLRQAKPYSLSSLTEAEFTMYFRGVVEQREVWRYQERRIAVLEERLAVLRQLIRDINGANEC